MARYIPKIPNLTSNREELEKALQLHDAMSVARDAEESLVKSGLGFSTKRGARAISLRPELMPAPLLLVFFLSCSSLRLIIAR